jgi:hypothetical protein
MDWRSRYTGFSGRKKERRWYGSNIWVYRGVQALVGEIFVPNYRQRADNPDHYKALIDARIAKLSHILPPKTDLQLHCRLSLPAAEYWWCTFFKK